MTSALWHLLTPLLCNNDMHKGVVCVISKDLEWQAARQGFSFEMGLQSMGRGIYEMPEAYITKCMLWLPMP